MAQIGGRSPPKYRSTAPVTVTAAAWQERIPAAAVPLSQTEYYRRHGADERTVSLVSLSGGAYGTQIEKIVRATLGLEARGRTVAGKASTGHDARLNGVRIEIKATRYTADGCGPFKAQHIQATHDFDLLLAVLLELNGDLVIIGITKADAIAHGLGNPMSREDFTAQGSNGSDQGHWIKFMDAERFFTPLTSRADLEKLAERARPAAAP